LKIVSTPILFSAYKYPKVKERESRVFHKHLLLHSILKEITFIFFGSLIQSFNNVHKFGHWLKTLTHYILGH